MFFLHQLIHLLPQYQRRVLLKIYRVLHLHLKGKFVLRNSAVKYFVFWVSLRLSPSSSSMATRPRRRQNRHQMAVMIKCWCSRTGLSSSFRVISRPNMSRCSFLNGLVRDGVLDLLLDFTHSAMATDKLIYLRQYWCAGHVVTVHKAATLGLKRERCGRVQQL